VAGQQNEEQAHLIRAVRQRLESLARAGVDRIPVPTIPEVRPAAGLLRPAGEEATPAPVSAPAESPALRPAAEAPRRASAAPAVVPSSTLFGESEFDEPPVPAAERPAVLAAMAAEISTCQRCPHLAATRKNTVFGTGNPNTRLMFVGEAPGADEDATGKPFVGRAGMLLTDMITKGMGLSRDEVYIANVLKSRPPENRTPLPDEVANCLPYLERQIAIVRPEFLCLLGRTAAQALLQTALPMSRLRGKWHRYRGILTIVTYHPSYLLRNPPAKKEAWDDLQLLMQQMGLTPPNRRKA
jgi:DNA polymerase